MAKVLEMLMYGMAQNAPERHGLTNNNTHSKE